MAPAGSAAPPLPSFTGVVAAYGLNNFNDAGYPGGLGISGVDNEIHFLGVAPYALDYTDIGSQAINLWADQNGNLNDATSGGANRPTLDATSQLISFDGTQTGLVGANPLYSGGSATGTIYVGFKAASLVETSVLLETGTGATDQAQRISIRLVAGVLTCSVYDATAVVCLANTKSKTISDNNWHLLAFTFDTGQGTAVNQTGLLVDNSSSGVSSPVSSTVAGLLLGGEAPNIGMRNNFASNFFTGSERLNFYRNTVDDAAAKTVMWNRWVYLQSLMP